MNMGLNDLPKIHEREVLCRKAESELRSAVIGVTTSETCQKLTTLELLQVMQTVFNSDLQNVLKYAIRFERHGNTDTPGGLSG